MPHDALASQIAARHRPQAAAVMRLWEYKVVNTPMTEERLAVLGCNGWELCICLWHQSECRYYYFFKRPLPLQPEGSPYR